MIVDLQDTSTGAIGRKLMELRARGGSVALGRVLNLIICTDAHESEEAIEAANSASRDHPCRVLVAARGTGRGSSRLDAQIRIGGDAGASEVMVLRSFGELTKHSAALMMPLLLPDTPVVTWWPGDPPTDPSADPLGKLAQRRVTDSARARRPRTALTKLAESYHPGDTDLAWSRITRWRSLLAAALDQPPFDQVSRVVVSGASDSPSTELLAAWLAWALKAPTSVRRTAAGTGVVGVALHRTSGVLELNRPEKANIATLTQPGHPTRQVSLAHRHDDECIAEELRRLDPDDVYGDVLTAGLALLDNAAKKAPAKKAPAKKVAAKKAAPAKKAATTKKTAAKKAAPQKATTAKKASSGAAAEPAG